MVNHTVNAGSNGETTEYIAITRAEYKSSTCAEFAAATTSGNTAVKDSAQWPLDCKFHEVEWRTRDQPSTSLAGTCPGRHYPPPFPELVPDASITTQAACTGGDRRWVGNEAKCYVRPAGAAADASWGLHATTHFSAYAEDYDALLGVSGDATAKLYATPNAQLMRSSKDTSASWPGTAWADSSSWPSVGLLASGYPSAHTGRMKGRSG